MNTMPNIIWNSGSMLTLLQKHACALQKKRNTLLERSTLLNWTPLYERYTLRLVVLNRRENKRV